MHNFWLAEILLALAALLVANQYWYIARSRCQSPALLIVAASLCLALAAAAGAYRYGIDPGVTELHRALSRLSATISFVLIGIALLWARLGLGLGRDSRAPAYVTMVLVIGSALGAAETAALSPEAVSSLYSTLGLLLWLAIALLELISARTLSRPLALLLAAGAVLVIFAGLVVGAGATRVLGLARINWFHFMLAAGALTLLCARPLFDSEDSSHG
ncbi:hypothetical protein SAMN04487965_1294 [Microbulbifer donghaiensis]|uniref:Uncharacterized protein n=1 Tax=Microbulbifer donghaiensis TaxID=494016 RepID=A0A1M4YML4_9GAMM|nr:hypothetical protein [Microbulbifer donghaiensis]SHF06981.1 hypothetical protein SAMN04487965_1294 [Microbulbifer donghaiensis]